MTVHLLVAPPATGKTRTCLERVREVFQARPLAQVWILVPDRLQAAALRARIAATGAVLPAQVTTFGELHRAILEEAGASLPVATDAMLHRLLQGVIRELDQAGKLPYYAPICSLPGFLLEGRDRIAELKRALVEPERVTEAAQVRADPALADLARIYGAYQARLQALGWADAEGMSWLAALALQSSPGLVDTQSLLVVDGFDDFNPAQLQTLKLAAERAAETWITLPGSPAMERNAHRRFAGALRRLLDSLTAEVITLPAPPRLPPILRQVEAGLFEPGALPAEASPGERSLQRIEARSPEEEAREGLRWLKARILRDGLSPAGCAVAVPNLDVYRAPLKTAAAEFGLPLRFTQGPLLSATPAAAALADLLQLAVNDFAQRPLLDTIRSPFFDLAGLGLRREDAGPLEFASRYGQIVNGAATWEDTLKALVLRAPVQEQADEDLGEQVNGIPRLPVGDLAARLLAGMQTLAARLAPPGGELSIQAWTLWLEELLVELKFFECLQLAEENDLLRTFDTLFARLAHSEALTGPWLVDYAGFLQEVHGLVSATALLEDEVDAGAPAILVMRLPEARGVRVRALAILGLAEGVFPAVERVDPFLSEEVRAALKLEPRLGQEQAGLFYQVVTRADQALLLSRPYLAKDGESWEPSPFWNEVQDLLPGAMGSPPWLSRIRPEDARPLEEAASSGELLFWATRRAAQFGPGLPEPFARVIAGPLAERWQQAAASGGVLAEGRLQNEAGGRYDGGLAELGADLNQRYPAGTRWSASRLESYATCPFFFFTGSTLRLEPHEPPGLGYQANQLGSLLHELLQRVYQEAADPADTAALLEHLPGIARRIFAEAPRVYGFRPSLLWGVQQEELLKLVEDTILKIADLDLEGGWRPLAFEVKFGLPDGGPPLRLAGEGGEILLHGVVDRIDINPAGQLRVIDYKAGSAHLGAQDLIEGRRLQLPVYALAASRALGLGDTVEGFYWKLNQGEPGGLRLSRFQGETGSGPEGAFSAAAAHIERIIAAIRSGDFAPRPPQGGCPSYCPAAAWCWHFRPVRW